MTEKVPIIKSIKCEIKFDDDYENAIHAYEYLFEGFNGDSFHFIIPNAEKDNVDVLVASQSDKEDYQPSIQKKQHDHQTKLDISNLFSDELNNVNKLSFAYKGPTSVFMHKSSYSVAGSYRAELIHSFYVETAKVIIELPKGSVINRWVGNAQVKEDGKKIEFITHDLKSNVEYGFPIFFYNENKVRATLSKFNWAGIGAALSVLLAKLFS